MCIFIGSRLHKNNISMYSYPVKIFNEHYTQCYVYQHYFATSHKQAVLLKQLAIKLHLMTSCTFIITVISHRL